MPNKNIGHFHITQYANDKSGQTFEVFAACWRYRHLADKQYRLLHWQDPESGWRTEFEELTTPIEHCEREEDHA